MLPYKIIGLLAIPGGWLITTERYAYVVAGPLPEQLSLTQLQIEQAGISQKSMCTLGEMGAAYASNDGIVIVQGLGATLASGVLFARKEWRDRYGTLLPKLRLAYHDGRLVGLFPGVAQGESSNYQGFTIRFDEGAPVYTRLAVNGSAMVIDPLHDQLLVGGGPGFKEFETGAPLPLTWQSKEFILPRPENLGAMMIDYTGGPFFMDTHANEQLVNPVMADGSPRSIIIPYSATRTQISFRLPSGFKAERYSFYFADAGSMIPGFWSVGVTYPAGWMVTLNSDDGPGTDIYSSLFDNNFNRHPLDAAGGWLWWKLTGRIADGLPAAQHIHRVIVASTMKELAGA
jgi:hypothetical protein